MTRKAINPVWVFAKEALKAAAWGALTGAMPTISEIKETKKRIAKSKKRRAADGFSSADSSS